jgi:glycosyltransferase involved in cell wall biosynthesis
MFGLSSESATVSERLPLSVIVITRNEEALLPECLASVRFARQVVVVDSGSTDDTVEVARAAGAEVHSTPDWPGFGPQKNRALALAREDWVLSLDADERVSEGLAREIESVVRGAQRACDAWEMPRRSSFCGQFINHSGWYPDRVARLFRRGTARFSDDIVHERLLPSGTVGRLRHELIHHSYASLENVLDKMNRYSTAGAQRLADAGRGGSLASAIAHGLWAFVRTYVLRAGFLDGRLGFVLAFANAEGTYYRYLKLWMLRRDKRG